MIRLLSPSVLLIAVTMAFVACGPSASPASSTPFGSSSQSNPTQPPAAAPTTPAQSGTQFQITLTGAAERPNPGDLDGTGTAKVTVNADKNEVCYDLSVSNIVLPATGAHIHSGSADSSGPIAVPFNAPGAGGSSSGCASGVAADVMTKLQQSPADYYVNVHTSDFPAGAVRGQLASSSSTSDPYSY